jgi:effector-binding domain-containing protein
MFRVLFTAEKAQKIDVDLRSVYLDLADFEQWKSWSPWICQEPDCPVTFEGTAGSVGHSMAWKGQRIGEGKMTLMTTDNESLFEYQLDIVTPFKSRSDVKILLLSDGDSTQVRWTMQGGLPFFLFFLKKMMSKVISCDYQRGLSMLKDRLEKKEVASVSELKGVEVQNLRYFVGKKGSCHPDNMEQAMSEVFCDMELPEGGLGGSIYHKYDFLNDHVDFACGYFLDSAPKASEGFEILVVPEHKALRADHTGAYRHLGNGWATAMGCQRSQKHKLNKGVAMYEIYRNDPSSVDHERELLTEIYVPVRA